MENKQLLPFERNRYYVGKMLTSADFQAEQTYFNNKRRFLNNVMYGEGIVCGLNVFSLDDQSVLIESGVAIDQMGREIVIENSIVKKLSALEGFEQLKTDAATLCLRYTEENVHSVYAITKSDREEPEFNRISEGYELFLMETSEADNVYQAETEFFAKEILFANDDYKIMLRMPATVCKGEMVKLALCVTKLSAENSVLNYSGILQIPAFLSEDNTHELQIDFENIRLKEGQELQKEFWLQTQKVEVGETNVVLKTGTATAQIDHKYAAVIDNVSLKIQLSDRAPRFLVAREIGKTSLEMRNITGQDAWVRLADIKLARTEKTYLIDDISEENIKKYIQTPADEMLRNEYLDYFREALREKLPVSQQNAGTTGDTAVGRNTPGGMEIATGTLEIPLGDHVKRGDIRYSGEIMHGLGKGNVYVEIGYESIEENRAEGANIKSTVYGNPSLFQKDNESLANVETAVKVLNDKGSFVVAAKLAKDVDFLVLTYQWVAIKFPTGNEMGDARAMSDKSIQAETPTVVLGAKETYYFGVKFINMESCSVAYELSENGSGEITTDGVYTAPNKDGVYEIRIYCTDNPIICTYAYAIVKKNKEAEDGEEK